MTNTVLGVRIIRIDYLEPNCIVYSDFNTLSAEMFK